MNTKQTTQKGMKSFTHSDRQRKSLMPIFYWRGIIVIPSTSFVVLIPFVHSSLFVSPRVLSRDTAAVDKFCGDGKEKSVCGGKQIIIIIKPMLKRLPQPTQPTQLKCHTALTWLRVCVSMPVSVSCTKFVVGRQTSRLLFIIITRTQRVGRAWAFHCKRRPTKWYKRWDDK